MTEIIIQLEGVCFRNKRGKVRTCGLAKEHNKPPAIVIDGFFSIDHVW